jgi:predicted phosphoribosyltransferase
VQRFDLVTTVPSGVRERDDAHPLRRIVAELTAPTRARHRRLLVRSGAPVTPHEFDQARYETSATLGGRSVLLIDDTWTTGANAQSAGAALKAAGGGAVAAVVIGRYLTRDWRDNGCRLNVLERPFAWDDCVLDADH